jgi:tetratricopeptide (TPR) repeat protein
VRRSATISIVIAAAIFVCISINVSGQAHDHRGQQLGKVHFQVSCSPEAQIAFDRAVALLHHMTYPQAREAFRQVAVIDPACSMAQWGVAMTLFQPLWPTRPSLKDRQDGWEAVKKARSNFPPTERERLFLSAVEEFFRDPASPDYWSRIRRWEKAQEAAFNAFPNDTETAVFFALAHLATTPSNVITRAHADRAAEILSRVYRQNPDHPGAMHYLVHANDVPGREGELLDVIRRYASVAPRNPHALHMPTHIFTRLGDWDSVINGNLRAAEAALEIPAGERGEFVWDEFPHAIEYLVYAYLQKGDYKKAEVQLKRLRDTARLEPTFKTAFHLASTQARYALERRAWIEASQIPPRQPADLAWDRFAWPEAIVQFARGLGFVRLAKIDGAISAIERIDELETVSVKAGEELFARNTRILRLELSAWVANAQEQRELAVQIMREAVVLEASTPKHAVTPGPTLPAEEQLGDLLLDQKRPADALESYKRSLASYPNRRNSLMGAARAAAAAGRRAEARRYDRLLSDTLDGSTDRQGFWKSR